MRDFFDVFDPQISERIVLKNKLAFAFVNQMPIVPGHVLVCPIRAVASSEELSTEEWLAILDLKKAICDLLRKTLHAEGFNFAWNEGSMAGQTVAHFHLHVLPRKRGDEGVYQYEPRSFLYRPGTRALGPKEEILEVVELIRKGGLCQEKE